MWIDVAHCFMSMSVCHYRRWPSERTTEAASTKVLIWGTTAGNDWVGTPEHLFSFVLSTQKRCLQVFTVLLLNLVTVVVIIVFVRFSVCLSANCTIAKLVVHWQIAHNLLSLLDVTKSVCCHKLFLAVWPICLTLWEADNWSASSCRLHSQAPICARISGCNLLRKSTFFVCLPWSLILYRSSRCSLSLVQEESGANATTKWLWCKWAEEGALARDRQTQSVAVRECASTAHT